MADFASLPPLAERQEPPFIAQNAHEIRMLVQDLESHKNKGAAKKAGGKKGFVCKRTSFRLPQLEGREVHSWRMNDWDYKRDDLPTYARGLFTYERSDGQSEIAVRGYDKFFNVDEVNDTRWRNVENGTRGPYELSSKENGCIIFISGLEGDKIIICSKHSTGERGDEGANHSLQGTKWLARHLATVGRTPEQLAKELRARNVTLVAELCDDAFEEHVLEYGPDVAGLYVHGMNLNLPEFTTYPFHLVQKFADEWGLKKAKFVVKDTLDETKAFLEKCGETGAWNGRDTEGFVVRCQKKVTGGWVDWFFKYKYDEPYLMYRQWREATKALIAGKPPFYKKHARITEAYLRYARQQLAQNPNLAKEYQKNHGIIAMREGFLKQQGVKGSDIIRAEEVDDEAGSSANTANDVVLVPISTIGCGKTTIANALVSLFGFGHVQNDNITGAKGRPQRFAQQIVNTLSLHPAVVADRNNHQRRERRQLMEDVSRVVPSVKYVALHYVHHPKDYMVPLVRDVTLARVRDRGDNHQTIRASSKDRKEIEGIMDGFLTRFEPAVADAEPDSGFELIIDMDPRDDSRQNLEVVVQALHKAFPKLVPHIPSAEDMDAAIDASLNDYSVQLKHDLSFGNKKPDRKENRQDKRDKKAKARSSTADDGGGRIEYFAARLPTDAVLDLLEVTFAGREPAETAFLEQLRRTGRVQPSFHLTLIHRASAASSSAIWQAYEERQAAARRSSKEPDPYLGPATLRPTHVVWHDGRIMAVACLLLDDDLLCANANPHVTIGTASPDVKPKESNDLLAAWRAGGVNAAGIRALPVPAGTSDLYGEVRAVLSS